MAGGIEICAYMYAGSLRGVYLFWSVSSRRCPDPANRCHAIRQGRPGTKQVQVADCRMVSRDQLHGHKEGAGCKAHLPVRSYSDYQMRGTQRSAGLLLLLLLLQYPGFDYPIYAPVLHVAAGALTVLSRENHREPHTRAAAHSRSAF